MINWLSLCSLELYLVIGDAVFGFLLEKSAILEININSCVLSVEYTVACLLDFFSRKSQSMDWRSKK